jgi:hypothetical protein
VLIDIPDHIAHRVELTLDEDDLPAVVKATKALNAGSLLAKSRTLARSLAQELESADPATRETAIRALATQRTSEDYASPAAAIRKSRGSGSTQAIERLVLDEMSRSADPATREHAWRALNGFDDQDAVPA